MQPHRFPSGVSRPNGQDRLCAGDVESRRVPRNEVVHQYKVRRNFAGRGFRDTLNLPVMATHSFVR